MFLMHMYINMQSDGFAGKYRFQEKAHFVGLIRTLITNETYNFTI